MFTDEPETVRAILTKILADENLTNDEQDIVQRCSALKDEFVAVLVQLRRFEPTGPESLHMAIGLSLNKMVDKLALYEKESLLWMSRLLETDGQRYLFFIECVNACNNRYVFPLAGELLEKLQRELSRSYQEKQITPSARDSMCSTCASQSVTAGCFDLMIGFLRMITNEAQKRHTVGLLALSILTRQTQYSYERSLRKPHIEHFFEALQAWQPQELNNRDEIEKWILDKMHATQ